MWRAEPTSDAGTVNLLRAASLALGTLLVTLMALLLIDWLLRADTLPVRNLRFEGEFRHVTQQDLERAVLDSVRGNFLLLNLDEVKERAESLPWVHRVAVRRAWPRDVAVQFSEQRPVARWGQHAWVNYLGEVVHVDGPDLPSDAPQLSGPPGTSAVVLEHYRQFREPLALAGLELQHLNMTARRTWEVQVVAAQLGQAESVQFELVLDRDEALRKIERFATLFPQALIRDAHGIRRIDLRYSNGFAVDWRSGQAASRSTRPAANTAQSVKGG
ncbi:MAG: cell division protein FtsQ/DivIB [Pseudomonadota bacterium]|nr:MAG: cell division protein FtsQ/DivIB [Pseudomonadota bacterium]